MRGKKKKEKKKNVRLQHVGVVSCSLSWHCGKGNGCFCSRIIKSVVTGVVPSPPRFLPSIFIAHRVQQSHCLSIFHRVLLTHALALSASQFVHKKTSQRIYMSMHSAGLELTKLTYTRLEDNLIRHRGDRSYPPVQIQVRGNTASPPHPSPLYATGLQHDNLDQKLCIFIPSRPA